MEALLEALCDRLTSSPSGSSLDELLVQIKHRASKRDASTDISLQAARGFFARLCMISPCLEEALMVVVSAILKHSESPKSLNEAFSLLKVPDGVPLDVLGWLRLILLRALGDRLDFGPDTISELRAWDLFDAPNALGIHPAKQGLFKARFMEALVRVLTRAHEDLEIDEALMAWILDSLFSSDDLVLQKARELAVAVLLRNNSQSSFFTQLLSLPAGMKIKYQLLTQLLDGSQQSRRRGADCPMWSFSAEFLREAKHRASTERGLAPAICDCLTAIMLSGCAEAEGFQTPSTPVAVLTFLMRLDDDYHPQLAKYLLPRLISVWPQLVKDFAASYKPVKGNQDALETHVLLLLTVATEFGGLPETAASDHTASLLKSALANGNDEIRLGAFGCLCRAFGPARPADPGHLALIAGFLRHLSLDSTANLRQKALVSLQALFCSLLSRLYTLFRTGADDEARDLLDWLKALLSCQLDCLDGAHRHQFGCVDLALRVLLEWSKALQARQQSKARRATTAADAALEAAMEQLIQETIVARGHLLTETVLDNSFDSSRRMAADLATVFSVPLDEERLREEAMRRLRSPREALATGAALTLLMLHGSPQDRYLDLLEAQLEHANRDIAAAAAENNLNGTLSLLAMLLEKKKIEPTQRLCDLAMAVGMAVASMASQPSPEGAELIPEAERATSQLILTFSWRAIKESTNLLSLVASVQPAAEISTLSPIMDHLVGLLLSLRHPGAFCAIEDPLRLVASTCFASPHQSVREYPGKVLHQAIQDCLLQPEIQVTRRSAGLPICIAAILTAAVAKIKQIDGQSASLIAVPAETMLALLRDLDLVETNPSPAIVHALNILRALFRNANLDPLTEPYLTPAFLICFRCFNSASWSVGNGAMMLLGALMRRAFGCTNLDIRQLAAKFPGLPAFLEAQVEATRNQPTASHIYPILSVLQRLVFSSGAIAAYPTFFESTFAFLAQTCLANPGAKIRMMAVRLISDSMLKACPEIVWPKLKTFLLNFHSVKSANQLSAILILLSQHSDKLVNELADHKGKLCALWKSKDIPAAIRWPALTTWSRITGCHAEPSDFDIHPRIEPYQYEFSQEILSHNSSIDPSQISWASLRYRLMVTSGSGNPTIEASISALKIDATPRTEFPKRPDHFGWELACLPARLDDEQSIVACLQAHSTNPDYVGICMRALVSKGLFSTFTKHALKYLTPENAFSDVIRLAVFEAIPSSWTIFDLDTFLTLRQGLVDDDEDVRLCAISKMEPFLDVSMLSIPAMLELLHRYAAQHLGQVYEEWRASLQTFASSPKSSGALLFAAEPLNLFATPSWEYSITL